MTRSVIYIDESDRSYGISGMAISLAVLDNGEKITGIDMDRMTDPLDLAHEFFFSGNPRFSARVVWREMARNFDLMVAMTIGNLLSRRVVRQGTALTPAEESDLRNLVIEEGAEALGLEADEVMQIWSKDYGYLKKVFAHPAIKDVTRQLASELVSRRALTGRELMELISALQR